MTIDTTSNALTFSAAASSPAANPKVVAATSSGIPSGTFADGDIIQINGTPNASNDGVFIVKLNSTAGTIEIRNVATSGDTIQAKFASDNFTAQTDNTTTVTIAKVNIMALRSSSTGTLEQQAGATDSSFSSWNAVGGAQSLQDAYDSGATITTASSTDLAFTLTSGNFTVDAGSVQFGQSTALGVFDVSATAMSLDASQGSADALILNASNGLGTVSIQNGGSNVLEVKSDLIEVFENKASAGSGTIVRNATGAGDDVQLRLNGNFDASLILTSEGSGTDSILMQTVTNGGGIDINSVAAVAIDAAAASNFTVAGANLTLSTTTSGEVDITSAGLMDLNAGANLDIDVTGTFDVLASSTFSIDGTGASNVTATSGNLTLSTTTSGNVIVSSAGGVDIDGGAITLDATVGVSIDAAAVSNFTVAGANLTLATTTSGNVALSAAGNITLSATYTDPTGTTFGDGSGAALLIDGQNGTALTTTTAASILLGVSQFDLCYMSGTGWQKADASAASTGYAIAIAGESGSAANGKVVLGGQHYGIDIPSGTPSLGDRVFLSETAGKGTLTAPTTAGSVVYQVGFVTNATAISGTIFQVVFVPQFILSN